MKRLLFAVLMAAASSCSSAPAFAQLITSAPAPKPSPSPAADPTLAWHLYSWAGAIRTSGAAVKPIVGARLEANLKLPAELHVIARLDASRQQDGGAGVDLTNPATFQSAEVYGGLYREVAHGFGLAGIYGLALPFEGGKLLHEAYPQTLLATVRFESTHLRVYAGGGKHEAAGPGWAKAAVTAEIRLSDHTATVVEAAGPGGFVRLLAAVRVK